MSVDLEKEQDLEVLRAGALELRDALRAEIAELRAQLETFKAMLFAPKSERQRTGTSDPASSRKKKDEKTPQTGHGPREQPKLPVEEELHELDEADRICPECGGGLGEMGEQTEDSEVIDYIPARYVLRRIRRQKYTCRCCGHLESALGPETLPGERRYTPRFSAHVAVQKYAMHMPLARQIQQMRRLGLVCDTQTLWDRLEKLATHLEPSYLALRAVALSQAVVGIDESEWRLLDKGRQKWPVWCVRGDGVVFYQVRQTRKADDVGALLEGFAGWAVSDGARCFASAEKQDSCTWKAGRCLAHVRRKLVQASKDFPEAEQAIELIAAIYGVEKRMKEPPEGVELETWRLRCRKEVGHGLEWLEAWAHQLECLPQSKLGKARDYFLGQLSLLKKVGEHPELWLDNNPTERSLRSPVLGRKNHYGSKSQRGTEVAALMYALVETCKLQGVDPEDYLIRAALADARNPGTITLPGDLAQPP